MIRLLSILLLATSFKACVAYDFEHEFWLKTDGSGSFVVTAPPWIWNAVKNVGDARSVESTVTEQAVAALFQDPAFQKPRVKRITRDGRPFIAVSADFSDINALVGTRAFPDLAVALRREGGRLRLFGVWRRPPSSGTAQGDDQGLMAVRFHIPSEIFEHRNASLGVERGNIVSWRQEVRGGIAGAPLDFGVTMGTRSSLRSTPGLFGIAILVGVGLIAAGLLYISRRTRSRVLPPPGPTSGRGSSNDANFLDYDPTSGTP